MLPVITYDDVAARFVDGDPENLGDQTQVKELIDDVLDDIQVRFGSRIEARLKAKLITERTVKRVVAAIVLRILRNPDGIYRESLGNYEYQMSQKVASGYLMYLPEEIETLVGAPTFPYGTVDMGVTNMGGKRVWS